MSRKLCFVLAATLIGVSGAADALTRHHRARTAVAAVTQEMEAAGYTGIRDVTSTGTGDWQATAERDGKTVQLIRTPDRQIIQKQ
jgi:hypothetical protein